MNFLNNPDLKNIYPINFKGTPLDERGRFKNLGIHYIPGFKDAMKWQFAEKPLKSQKKQDNWRPGVISDETFLNGQQDCIVWLGHASFYIRLGGKRILIDPVFNKATVVKRLISFPCKPDSLKNIDYLFISHNHRDHTDEQSLKIIARNNPHIQIFTGLGQEVLLKKWFPKSHIQAAGWFQEFNAPEKDFTFSYVPSRHWSKRWLKDDNKTLWGGFVLQYQEQSIYFMGDSGYGDHFKLIAEQFPQLDYCIMGIGAFRPEWFMGPSHISPTNAVKAFNEMGGRHFIPMHYGTFDLSDEPISEPLNILKALHDTGEINGKLITPDVGQTIMI